MEPVDTSVHLKPTTGSERRKDVAPTVANVDLFLLAELLLVPPVAQAMKVR